MWTYFGAGTFLWHNAPMLAERYSITEGIDQTKAAVLADDHSQLLLRSIDESKAALKTITIPMPIRSYALHVVARGR